MFDAGANRAQIRVQQALVEQARISYRSTVLTALQEVEDALVQLQGDKDRLVQLKIAEEAARYAQLLANQRYSSGLVDFQTVLGYPAHFTVLPKIVWPRHKPRSARITCACTKRWGAAGNP